MTVRYADWPCGCVSGYAGSAGFQAICTEGETCKSKKKFGCIGDLRCFSGRTQILIRRSKHKCMMNEEKFADIFLPYTTAVFKLHRTNSIEFFGSALMIQHIGKYYLVSAAHVLDHLNDEEPLFINLPTGLIRLEGNICSTATANQRTRRDDPIDIGVMALPESHAHLFENASFVTSDKLDTKQEVHAKHGYVVAGYPVTKNKNSVDPDTKSINPSAYIGLCWEADDDVYSQLNGHRGLSLALNFNRKKVFSIEGTKRTAPALNGLSGAPVWGFTKDGAARVAGILIEHHQGTKKCIVATRSVCIMPPIEILINSNRL